MKNRDMNNAELSAVIPESMRQRCEVWTRVMGYHRPVSSFNAGKCSEHKERLHFRETKRMSSPLADKEQDKWD